METKMVNNLKEKINTLLAVPHCYPDLKTAGAKYLDAIGTIDETQAAKEFYKELEEDVLSIDSFIVFTASDAAVNMFGKDNANKMHDSALEAKKNGEKYCTCAACQAGKELLLIKDDILNN